MAEFDELREQLESQRAAHQKARDAVARARELVKRIDRRAALLDRAVNDQNPELVRERERLRREREAAAAAFDRAVAEERTVRRRELEVFAQFSKLSDPREGIARWSSEVPILLLPVRLETRFKSRPPRAGAAPVDELWVRIFPDDCWVDGFDPTLTETEALDARAYFAGIWKAGGIEEQERAAWRTLVSSVGAGRAAWIRTAYQPAGFSQKPAKARPEDVILTIVTPSALPSAEQTALAAYWSAAWRADGAAVAIGQARTALEAAIGVARAAALVTEFPPVNFADVLPAGVTRDAVALQVAFLVFTPPETKQSAWSHAPALKVLPDRFVFIGHSGDRSPLVQVGAPVPTPLPVGPDPSLPEAEQLRHDADGNLIVTEELRWLTDFERAVEVGMGFRIPLDAAQARAGFDRVLVVGLCLQLDESRGQAELENLLRHHRYGRHGLELLPQGTPTNNTEAGSAGFDRFGDADRAFDDLKQPLFTPSSDWLEKRDGQWLAEYLGVDPALFQDVHGAGGTDQAAARALHVALWPATVGHWMESMMAPLFDDADIEATRRFFTRYVIGGGAVPAIRIGSQPYGILPATAFSHMDWLEPRFAPDTTGVSFVGRNSGYLARLNALLLKLEASLDDVAGDVSFVGKAGDPHQLLLDIVGLHPGSVEFSQRYAESLTSVYNRLNLMGLGGFFQALLLSVQRGRSRELLQLLGGNLEAGEPQLLNLVFGGTHHELRGGLVDDRPLSETEPIRDYTASGQNYLEWLIDAARTSLDALYRQDGFDDDAPPTALLYLLLRHALQLGYHDVSVRLHEQAGLYSSARVRAARLDQPFLHIREQASESESRYQPLYARSAAITGAEQQPVHAFISDRLPDLAVASGLRDQLAALERLTAEPTARLARAFADHIDCGAYRLDAWRLGLVHFQLARLRNLEGSSDGPSRGVQLGAYGWLEDLRPENKQLSRVVLDDPELVAAFEGAGEPPLERDSTNQGYVHAPSLNHAVAAAVLRNGFISSASAENRQTLAVNLTSERVRTALGMLEGIRAGQSLSDLLGYQFERGLHDRHGLAEVDEFVFKLRKEFPLRGDRFQSTKTESSVPIEAIEARNVVNGLALVEHMKTTGKKTYPFGKANLPEPIPAPQAAAINAEADRLLETHDAVADLALAEGVYQAVLGNYDRVASTYDAYARGNFPPEPQVVRTPRSGVGLTHRVALHLPAGQSPTVSPLPGVPMTPRAQAEPALNAWLAGVLPALDQVSVLVEFRAAATGATTTEQVTLKDLSLQPADVLALVRDSDQQAMGELEDRILRRAVTSFGVRPDAPVSIRHLETSTAPYSLFELMPLVRSLRELTTRSRPLKSSDLALSNEATAAQDQQPFVSAARLELVRNAMTALRTDLGALETTLEGPLSDLETRLPELLASVDQYLDDLVELLARAATFNVLQAGWGFAYDFRARTYRALLEQVQALLDRWLGKLDTFDALLLEESALPAGATDAERFTLLLSAEQAVSTAATSPLPATPAAYRTLLLGKRAAFQTKRDSFAGLLATTHTRLSPLLADVRTRLPIDAFDATPFELESHEAAAVRFVRDALQVVQTVDAELERRLATATPLFTEHAAAEDAARAELLSRVAEALLGADFRIFPEFSLSATAAAELANALAHSRSGQLFEHLTAPPDPARPSEDFPVDTWLYGVARVREKLGAWERVLMFSGSLGRAEPELEAIQLPFVPGDRWLGLDLAEAQKLDQDRLLYTACFGPAFAPAASTCGLLLDEWSETIPLLDVDTGITFHYDRPNTEAPQAFLLVTPSRVGDRWQWDDLLDAVRDTFELARRRAIEPSHIDRTPLAPFAPSTIVVSQVAELTIAANLALNNRVALALDEA